MVNNHYRWDFIGLSTDEKPTPTTSEKVVDGSTFYCSDNSKLYVWCKDNWYEKTVSGGGGGGVTPVQTTGTSTTDVMSQNAVTSMVFADPANKTQVQIGSATQSNVANTIMIGNSNNAENTNGGLIVGNSSYVSGNRAVALGRDAQARAKNSVAFSGSNATLQGQFDISVANDAGSGYNDSNYRLLTGLYDPQNAHDAATKGYVDSQGGGGGDSVYSTVTTSNSNTGGAVYIGNLNSSQEEQPDPTTIDSHYKYFWALPSFNNNKPVSNSITILGNANGQNSISIGSSSGTSASGAVAIGTSAISSTDYSLAIGNQANVNTGTRSIALGNATIVNANNGVAIGSNATVTRDGEVNVGAGTSGRGYNSTNYRVIGGVHDGQLANDVTTVGQINALIDAINTTLSTNIPHIGANS